MSKGNALLLAQELANEGKWDEVYTVCLEYMDDIDHSSYEVLNSEQIRELSILLINSMIKCMTLGDFLSLKDLSLQEIYFGNPEEDNVFCGCLYTVFNGISGFFEEESQIENLYKNIQSIVLEKCSFFLKQTLSYIYETITVGKNLIKEDPVIDGFNRIFFLRNILNSIINMGFIRYFKKSNFDKGKYENDYKIEFKKIFSDMVFETSLSMIQKVRELTVDFPYFSQYDAKIVLYCYDYARFLIECIFINVKTDILMKCEINKITMLKQKINIICDELNAIIIADHGKVSLIVSTEDRQKLYNEILECEKEVQKFESEYSHPAVNIAVFKKHDQGCYVATAVYGSYDCPQVWTLRRYRDYTLAGTWYGRAFVKTYYAISPTLVKWFGNTEWFKKMWRGKLDSMVERLQSKGVEDTPYEDIKWK